MEKIYYGQFNPPFDYYLEQKYLGSIQKGIGIECGAFDGVEECNLKFFEDNQNWTVYNIEAALPIYDRLCINRPKSFNYNLALSRSDGEAIFHHAIHPYRGDHFGNGSIKHTKSHYRELLSNDVTFKDFIVKTITYKTFIENNNIKNVDCFVLDVEGHELDVLYGMKDCDVLPKIFMIEYPHITLDVLNKLMNEYFPNKYIFDGTFHNSAFYKLKE